MRSVVAATSRAPASRAEVRERLPGHVPAGARRRSVWRVGMTVIAGDGGCPHQAAYRYRSRPLRQHFDQHDTSHESSHVSPERDSSTGLAGLRNRGRGSAQKLHEEPVSQHQPGGQVKEKNRRKPHQHVSSRIQYEISAHHAGNRPARPYARYISTQHSVGCGQPPPRSR